MPLFNFFKIIVMNSFQVDEKYKKLNLTTFESIYLK